MTWDPGIYSTFAAPRLRPARDLMARVPIESPGRIADLGCGTGNVTHLLAERWPRARVSGIDSSPEMLAAARAKAPSITWIEADIGDWSACQPLDLLFSNAALHWLDDHAGLFPSLMRMLAPGGCLAVQMPCNHKAPSHTCLVEAAEAGPWAALLAPHLRRSPVAPAAFYYDVLAPLAADLDIWQTEYMHVLDGADPVLRWTMGTVLRPLLDVLEGDWRDAFLADYAARLAAAYPPRADGRTLLAFRRLFIVAVNPV